MEFKTHFPTEKEARQLADKFIRSWEVSIGLRQSPDHFISKFQSSVIIDRSPPPKTGVQTLSVMGSGCAVVGGKADVHASYAQFPGPCSNFSSSLEVEMMFYRYSNYRKGNEPLPSMAYWCASVIEYHFKGFSRASNDLQVSKKIFEKLSALCSNRGDPKEARKMKGQAGSLPLIPAEKAWIDAVVRTLIQRVGEYAYDPTAKLPQITMADFPDLQ